MPREADHTRTPLLADALCGVSLLAGGANVVMQLARPEVGRGVVRGAVPSGDLFSHPLKRTRTTTTYLAVAALGTPAERAAYRAAINRVHRQVRRSGQEGFDALDPDQQLWVAACLFRGLVDLWPTVLHPGVPIPDALVREAAVLGTMLQVGVRRWPDDHASFEQWWADQLDGLDIPADVADYLRGVLAGDWLPGPLPRLVRGWLPRLSTGFLPPRFRELLGLTWTDADQSWFDARCRWLAAAARLPGPLRRFPFNLALTDLRVRRLFGIPLV